MQRAVNRLLGRPQLGRHLGELALLVVDDQTFRLLEPGGGCEERSVRRKSGVSLSPNAPYSSVRSLEAVLTHVESRCVLNIPALTPSLSQDPSILLFLVFSQRSSSTISPRIGKVRGVSHAAPVCAEIILRRRKVPAAREGSRHDLVRRSATGRNVLWRWFKSIGGRATKANGFQGFARWLTASSHR